jgi:hypothetical protein
MTDLLLRRAPVRRPGADGPDDYDVIGTDGQVIGRIFKAVRFPNETPWEWTIYGYQEDRSPTHGYKAARGAAMEAFARSWYREPSGAMNLDREREHLAQLKQQIAECKAHIARQREIIAELRIDDHEIDIAESMLHALEGRLRAFGTHRDVILQRLKSER